MRIANPRKFVSAHCVLADRYSCVGDVRNALEYMGGCESLAIGFAVRNRTLPQIYKNIRAGELENEAPVELLERAKEDSMSAAAYNMLLVETAAGLMEAAAGGGVDLLPFKGLSLVDRVFEPDERSMSDMDFIVNRRQLDALDALLNSLGWTREPSGLPPEFDAAFAGERKYIIERGGARIDAEFRWEPSPGPALGRAFPLDPETSWRLSESNSGKHRLTPEGDILLCVHHLAVLHSFGRLMWFIDVRYLSEQYREEIDWPSLWKEFADSGLAGAADCIFSFLEKYMGMEKVPREKSPGKAGVTSGFMERLVIESLMGGGIKKTGAIPGLFSGRKRGYFAGYLFPGWRYMRMRYPDVPAPLLPFHRVTRLLKKGFSGSQSFKYDGK